MFVNCLQHNLLFLWIFLSLFHKHTHTQTDSMCRIRSISVRQSMCHLCLYAVRKINDLLWQSSTQAERYLFKCHQFKHTPTHTQRERRTHKNRINRKSNLQTPYLSSHFQFGTRNMGYYEIWPKWVINFQNWMCKRIDNQQLLIRIIEVGLKKSPQMSQTTEQTNLSSMRTINGRI